MQSEEFEAQQAFDEGNRLYEEGDFTAAVAQFDRSLELRPDDLSTLNRRGLTLYNMGLYEAALGDFSCSLELQPSDPDTWHRRGITCLGLARYGEALGDLAHSLELRPDHPDTLNNRGVALLFMQKYEEALDNFNRAISAGERRGFQRPLYWHNRAKVFSGLGDWPKCRESFEKVFGDAVSDAAARNGIGVTLLALGENEAAIRIISEVVKENPEEPLYHYNLAVALYRQHKRAGGKDDWAISLEAQLSPPEIARKPRYRLNHGGKTVLL